jgi:hypothetical protein
VTGKLLFSISATLEVPTGLALLAAPVTVVDLLLGGGLDQVGIESSRILGVALIAVGIAGLEIWQPGECLGPRIGLCTYNVGLATVLAY